MPHARSLPLAVLLSFALLAGPARASTVTFGNLPFATVTYTAEANEDNSLTVSRSGAGVVLSETGTKNANPITISLSGQPAIDNCAVTGANSNVVTCPAGSVIVALGDLDDDASTSYGPDAGFLVAMTISGDAGSDTLTSTAPATPGAVFANVLLSGGPQDDVLIGGSAVENLSGGDGADRIRGGGGADLVSGGPGNDPELDGQAGDDNVQGGGGVDVLLGGDGDDTLEDGDAAGPVDADRIDGGPGMDLVNYPRTVAVDVTLADDPGAAAPSGNDGQGGEGDAVRLVENVAAGSGNDHLAGSAGPNQLTGNGGDDTIAGGEGDDAIAGGDGNDPRLDGEGGSDSVDGGPGSDVVSGGAGDDRSPLGCSIAASGVFGGDGNDTVDGGSGNDAVCGGSAFPSTDGPGQDHLRGGPGADVLDDMDFADPGPDRLDGGDGRDVGIWNRRGDVDVTLGDDPGPDALIGNDGAAGEADAARALEGAVTGAGNDTVAGSGVEDRIETGAGNDAVDGAGGDDWISGDGGNDNLLGGDGEDELNGGGGRDGLAGGGGDDILDDGDGGVAGGEPDSLDGGPGGDLVRSYVSRRSGVLVDLATGSGGEAGEGDGLSAIEHVLGGAGDDQLFGNADGNELLGGLGNDSLDGRAGSDSVQGEGGSDSLVGGPGIDELRGGRGADSLDSRDAGADQVGCGADIDGATGDTADAIDLDCETITKAASIAQPKERSVSCAQAKKPKGKGKKRRYSITCTVDPDAPKGARAILRRGTRTVARGAIANNRVTFKVRRRQKAGRYSFQLTIGGRTTRFEVRLK